MRFVAISDTHNKLDEIIDQVGIPDGDVLIHAGDATALGKVEEFSKFNQALGRLNHPVKIFIAGNHDIGLEKNPHLCEQLLTNVTYYLRDSYVELDGIKIWGAPWQPQFYNWAFNLRRGAELKAKWDLIPSDTDILITHGPPFGCLDWVARNFSFENIGCKDLKLAIERVRPKFHIFGHYHGGYGFLKKDGTTFINASSLTESYSVSENHKPIVFHVERF